MSLNGTVNGVPCTHIETLLEVTAIGKYHDTVTTSVCIIRSTLLSRIAIGIKDEALRHATIGTILEVADRNNIVCHIGRVVFNLTHVDGE